MATTPHLGITLVEQAQAQKEVTVNMALARIDALLNCGAKSRAIATPPVAPADGDVYIVAASPTGDWSGQPGKIAYFDAIWRFITPREGVTLWVNDEDVAYSYDGAAWVLSNDPSEFQNLSLLGVNATADSTNKLAVASSAVLFNNVGAGVQAKLNKNSASDTASFLFQTGASGRAEFGTTGDDNFTMKVSSNGSTWLSAIKIMAATGRVAFKSLATGISAAGTTQGTATALTKSFNEVTTVAASAGVILPSPEAGEIVVVANQGANALNVYPASGHSINSLSANTAQSLATDTRRIFFALSTSKWYSL
jgi:hypothetical protein